MEEIINLVSAVGIPAAICFFVLVRMERTIKDNTKAIMAMLNYVKKH